MARLKQTSIAFELNNKPDRFGMFPISLRITKDRVSKRVATSVSVKLPKDSTKQNIKAYWNPNYQKDTYITQKDSDHVVKNNLLRSIRKKALQAQEQLEASGKPYTAESLVDYMANKAEAKSFLKFAKKEIGQIYDAGRLRDWKKHSSALKKLEGYLSSKRKKDLLFADLTPSFMNSFNKYLNNLRNERNPEKKLHPNSIAVVFSSLRTMINKAIAQRKMLPESSPFLSFKISTTKSVKEKLESAEIEAMKAVELEEGSQMWHSRNCFLFSFYCAGIRVGDLLQLRWLNVEAGRLHYQMGKNHKEVNLKLMPQAEAILALYKTAESTPTDYIFPFMSNRKTYASATSLAERDTLPSDMKLKMIKEVECKTATIDHCLKTIAKKAGIEKNITMHIARHSFAKLAKQSGTDNSIVKGMLAHSSLSVTERYMGEFDTSATDQALNKMFADDTADKKAQLLSLIQSMNEEEVASMLASLKK